MEPESETGERGRKSRRRGETLEDDVTATE